MRLERHGPGQRQGAYDIHGPFRSPGDRDFPYMVHCHILEHEDMGMMGQFTVT
ncbi:MAG: hypothetical protein CMQ24_07300 [Gammaproteobacteria bacterium]|nr:hypothetical protein [Gammaproteobacteria bacterium]